MRRQRGAVWSLPEVRTHDECGKVTGGEGCKGDVSLGDHRSDRSVFHVEHRVLVSAPTASMVASC